MSDSAAPSLGAERVCVDVALEAEAWRALDLDRIAERAFGGVARRLSLPETGWEVSILACDDARIAQLNADFRARPGPTNVLSWPSMERAPGAAGRHPAPPDPRVPELGDVALAFETCEAEARSAGLALGDHVHHLLVHAILHLLGYDHETDLDANLMERLETEILASLGIADPYGRGGLD